MFLIWSRVVETSLRLNSTGSVTYLEHHSVKHLLPFAFIATPVLLIKTTIRNQPNETLTAALFCFHVQKNMSSFVVDQSSQKHCSSHWKLISDLHMIVTPVFKQTWRFTGYFG